MTINVEFKPLPETPEVGDYYYGHLDGTQNSKWIFNGKDWLPIKSETEYLIDKLISEKLNVDSAKEILVSKGYTVIPPVKK